MRSTLGTAGVLILFTAPLLAHGGQYNPPYTGPGGGGPPHCGLGGSGPGAAPVGPGAGVGAAPRGGSGPGSPSSPSGKTGAPGGPGTGPMTQGGPPFDPTLWNHWWAFNHAAYLDLRRHVHEVGVVTGSDLFFLGQGSRPESTEDWSPRRADIDGKVVPALIHVLETERSNHMLSAALIALGKIGADSSMPAAFEQALLPFLADSTQEVAESAAIGLGILARDNVLPTLAHLARDTQRGRKLVGRKSEVPYRTRAFAAFGLGLLAERTSEETVRRVCAAHLIELLEAPHFSTRDIKIAAITALGLCGLDDREGEVAVSTEEGLAHSELSLQASSCRSALLDYLLDYFDPDQRRSHDRTRHELVLAHVPRTLVRLLPDESRDTGHPWKQRVWELFAGSLRPHAKERLEIVQGVLFSLGQLADADDDPVDQKIRQELDRQTKEGRYREDRVFALMSLAQAGARRGSGEQQQEGVSQIRKRLFERLANGRGPVRPWAALALGVLGEGQVPSEQTPQASLHLREATQDCKRPMEIGAYALALGLRRDAAAVNLLLGKLDSIVTDAARSACSVALGLVGEDRATDALRELVATSTYRPELLTQASIGLALLGDKTQAESLATLLGRAQGLASQASLATALGTIGDRRSITPLLEVLRNDQVSDSARGFAVVALGMVCDQRPLPWNASLAANINYPAATATLTSSAGTGVLDIF